jgi:diguanylate cyclase (GGDEF)-like protein
MLVAAGMVVVLLVANLDPAGLGYGVNQAALNLVVAVAGISVVGILLFPWRRYDRNLFLVASLGGMCLIALAVYFSGGWQSSFFPLYFFVVVFSAIYYSPRVAAAVVFLTALVSLSPQLYDPDASRMVEHAMVFFPSYLALTLVSGYMAREVGRRERQKSEYERELEQMRELKERFRRETLTDHLTGLPNRHRFETRLGAEIARARRRGGTFTVLFVDVDDFKRINDAHGHASGDEALKIVADALRRGAREEDTVARHGGEEFTVLLAGTPFAQAPRFFLRVREEVARRTQRELGFRIGLSAGAAGFPQDAKDPEGLLEAADLAMYQAKSLGKDGFFHRSSQAG